MYNWFTAWTSEKHKDTSRSVRKGQWLGLALLLVRGAVWVGALRGLVQLVGSFAGQEVLILTNLCTRQTPSRQTCAFTRELCIWWADGRRPLSTEGRQVSLELLDLAIHEQRPNLGIPQMGLGHGT